MQHVSSYPQLFKHLGMAAMIGFCCCYLVLVAAIAETLPPASRLFSELAKLLALGFVVVSGLAYFVQLTATRFQLEAGYGAEILQLTQSFPSSALNAANIFGWTLLYGLSTLFLALACRKLRQAKPLFGWALANAAVVGLGGLGYLLNLQLVVFFCLNLGLGLTSIGLTICALRLFRATAADQLCSS